MIQTRIQSIVVFLLVTVGLCLTGCDETASSPGDKTFAIDQAFPRGPLTVHVRVDSNSVSIAQLLTVELEAAIQPGYRVKMPAVDKLLEQFGIVDRDALGEKLDKDMRTVTTVRYELEPFLTGTYDIPAFQFQFFDVNDPNKTYTLETEPIPVEITSLLGEDRENLVIEDIEGVVVLPTQIRWLWVWERCRSGEKLSGVRSSLRSSGSILQFPSPVPPDMVSPLTREPACHLRQPDP